MDALVRYIGAKLREGFGIDSRGPYVEKFLSNEKIQAQFVDFCKPSGISTLTFYYQPPEGDDEGTPELLLNVQKKCRLRRPALFFVRQNPKGIGSKVEEDVCFGQIATGDPLGDFDRMLSHVFMPLVKQQTEWGKAKLDDGCKDVFLEAASSLQQTLDEALSNIKGGLKLEMHDPRWNYIENKQKAFETAALNSEIVSEFEHTVCQWTEQIQQLLYQTEPTSHSNSIDDGPRSELDYWRMRSQRFCAVIDQVKCKECKVVLGVLREARQTHENVQKTLKNWRSLDNEITDAANEAKDNVKYLATLDKFMEVIYTGTTEQVAETLPTLLNNVKMMQQISRYYNTEAHMTQLLTKMTNQLIVNCMRNISQGQKLWDHEPATLIKRMQACDHLYDMYQEQFQVTKNKVLLTHTKNDDDDPFDLNENIIFSKFDLFSKRLQKVIEMFTVVQQFSTMATNAIEAMQPMIEKFDDILEDLKRKNYDLLDHTKTSFERDFLEFQAAIHHLESSLQGFINSSFETIPNTQQALKMLSRFQCIITRETLKADLENKHMVIFQNYGLDLDFVQRSYEKFKKSPPMVRTTPRVAGSIIWSRQLLRRIEEPMNTFQTNRTIMSTKESKKIIRTYNRVATALVQFETLWHQAWCGSIEAAKAGLAATLLIRQPGSNKLYANFDHEIVELIREAKCLMRLGIQVPEGAKMVSMQHDKFKNYYGQLLFSLKEYDRVMARISPVVRNLLQFHLEDLDKHILPGLTTITWTSLNIPTYLESVAHSLGKLDDLVTRMNDMIENRIESNLKIISRTVLVDLDPSKFPFNVAEFVSIQEQYVKEQIFALDGKNLAVELAVEDLLQLVNSVPLDQQDASAGSTVKVIGSDPVAIAALKEHYNRLMYHAIFSCIRTSFGAIKNRVGVGGSGLGGLGAFDHTPFFQTDVELNLSGSTSAGNVIMSPSLDDIQDSLNRTAVSIIRSTRKMVQWGADRTLPSPNSFFEELASEKQLVKVILLLSGALFGAAQGARTYLDSFSRYSFLWKDNVQSNYAKFLKKSPTLEDFDDELEKYAGIETEIKTRIEDHYIIGVLSLQNVNIKATLVDLTIMWKGQYTQSLTQIAREDLNSLVEYMSGTTRKFGMVVESLEDVRKLMGMLSEVSDKESTIEWEFGPLEQKYEVLQHYGVKSLTKEELLMVSELRTNWEKLKGLTLGVAESLGTMQKEYKVNLVRDVIEFKKAVGDYTTDYEQNGPGASNIKPKEAIDRLNRYERDFADLERKYTMFNAGEVLFGMPTTNLEQMTKTRKELKLLRQLYGLYENVDNAMNDYNEILWVDVVQNIDAMTNQVNEFQRLCRGMPKALKGWDAYRDLASKIDNLLETLPLLQHLSNKAMKPRHWNLVGEITGTTFEIDANTFKVKNLLEANLLSVAEEVEEVSMAATKEFNIGVKLDEMDEKWADRMFIFVQYKNRNQLYILQGTETGEIQEELEESLMTLGGMASSRYALPFKETVDMWIHKLGETTEVIERWLYLQVLWMNLEAVFAGGDIAKQLPQDSKRFVSIDKTWVKFMSKSVELRNVVGLCYANDMLQFLQPLIEGLETCQKSLASYLETKRSLFPRFYFVSDPVLLEILSQGSDPPAIQPFFQACFDSIDSVEFDAKDKKKICAIHAQVGQELETVGLSSIVVADGNIEEWMGKIEAEMQRSLKDIVKSASVDCHELSIAQFINKPYCAQVCLLGVQMQWTLDAHDAISRAKAEKQAMPTAQRKITDLMRELCEMTQDDCLTKRDRTNIETLITIQVHQKDVFDDLVKKKLRDPGDFMWQQQARFYWQETENDCFMCVCEQQFPYCYEFLGCEDRLVITPLTDRCYITLTQALGMCKGGAPAGPAGTGKTETTKDLARAMGKYCVVTNCGPEMDFKATGKIFKGIAMCGAWGCFDEFNRIDLEVLSVCAQQIACVLNALRDKSRTFLFTDGSTPSLKTSCGYFITMNPGYAGRQELPENLKELFRGVTMMVPDRQIIMKVKLAAAGYQDYPPLSVKFHCLYQLCEQQLSKQPHYDFGLRNILSVLRTAGTMLRNDKKHAQTEGVKVKSESFLLCRTLRDMNMSKFVAEDVGLFLSLVNDLFPGLNPPKAKFPQMEQAALECCDQNGLLPHPSWMGKITQLYETYLVRHGIMVVGSAGCGKTQIITVLREALSKADRKHTAVRMNPKAITAKQMYGFQDPIANEWTEGIFTALWKKANDPKKKSYNQWIVMDGPVDAIWIEDLNTVLDDNKMLTCANGDRIPMLHSMKLLFEPENLNNASPATVSRAGIIFVSGLDLGWHPMVQAWLKQRENVSERAALEELFGTFLASCEEFMNTADCRVVMEVPIMNLITSCLSLVQGILPELRNDKDTPLNHEQLEQVVIYGCLWSFGALYETGDRHVFEEHLRTLSDALPPITPEIDAYCWTFDEKFNWIKWVAKPLQVSDPDALDFASLLVPTVDSLRVQHLMDIAIRQKKLTLLVGGPGTAKTCIVMMYVAGQTDPNLLFKRINFSSATTPGIYQNIIESCIDKRSGKIFGPPNNKKLLCFLDDVSMPEVNKWGDQVTLELIRQLSELGYFWNTEKSKAGEQKIVEDLSYILAMNHPGGGKNDVPNRMKRHCLNINVPMPTIVSIHQMFGSILKLRFNEKSFKTNVIKVATSLVSVTMQLYELTKAKLLPTPAKFHYIFNLRDVSRVFQGMMTVPKAVQMQPTNTDLNPTQFLLGVWKHECERVFADKLREQEDKDWFRKTVLTLISQNYGTVLDDRSAAKPLYLVDFLREAPEDEETGEMVGDRPKIYEAVSSLDTLRSHAYEIMMEMNSTIKVGKLELVLFDDALIHMTRISRIIAMPRGCAMLVGVGGSGKQSLTTLASYIAGYTKFQITASKSYGVPQLLEDIKNQYLKAGFKNPVTFVMTDSEVKDESFLEYVNMVLSTGEIPGLIPKDELEAMIGELLPIYEKVCGITDAGRDEVIKYFYDNVRTNLHIVLCFSPVGEKFRDRALKFPALFSGTTIDWFMSWPEEALRRVAGSFINDDSFDLLVDSDEMKSELVNHIAAVHMCTSNQCAAYFQRFRRNVYVTPKSFLSFISIYKKIYGDKLGNVKSDAEKITNGLAKLKEAETDVSKMKVELAKTEEVLAKTSERMEVMVANLKEKSAKAEQVKAEVTAVKNDLAEVAASIQADRDVCNSDLAAAQPALEAATKALDAIRPDDINTLKKLAKPPNLIRRIFDGVILLKREKINLVEIDPEYQTKGGEPTILASYDLSKRMMTRPKFLEELRTFDRDTITDETCELMSPYLEMDDFDYENASRASGDIAGLCNWCKAMVEYYFIAKFVAPKVEALKVAEVKLKAANDQLSVAQAELDSKEAEVNALNAEFSTAMGEKMKIQNDADLTKAKMSAATQLISGLAGEKQRWTMQSKQFNQQMRKLVGDVAIVCGFVSYCGPFNSIFRQQLLKRFSEDCEFRELPKSSDTQVVGFIVDDAVCGQWNLEGLPSDQHSLENGIMTTKATRWPVMIDPQNQANSWIKNHESQDLLVTTLGDKFFRRHLETAMADGQPLLIQHIEEEVDPVLEPVLNKMVTKTGKTMKITLPDKPDGSDYDEKFRLYFTTKLANPHYTPELSAQTTVIDFTVTMQGLEDQLLSIVVLKERPELQEQRTQLMKEITANKSKVASLEAQLLHKLSTVEGNLLDDKDIIDVLNNTKQASTEVQEKLQIAGETQLKIQTACEDYRPVATRGSIIYFLITEMALINPMYQVSLTQFLELFEISMVEAPIAPITAVRCRNIIDETTFRTFSYITRGIFEAHKLVYVFLLSLKLQLRSGDIGPTEFGMLLKGGAALDIKSQKRKPAEWIPNAAWLNVCELSGTLPLFSDLPDCIAHNLDIWKAWYDLESPESSLVPDYEGRMKTFQKLVLVRSLRPDRMLTTAKEYISEALGGKYLIFKALDIEATWTESSPVVPLIFLLSPGANPNQGIMNLAKRKKTGVDSISMGQGQEVKAQQLLDAAVSSGSWVLLQNTHLGLSFMRTIEPQLIQLVEVDPFFRLWITCEPHPAFPIGLLQMSIKMTDEPPMGLKAGLKKAFGWLNQDWLEAVNRDEWRPMLHALCFLHTIVVERRKFGALGWNIPYEFNQSDFEASAMYMRTHMTDVELRKGHVSWTAIQYMICDVQYGGRITDNLDRRLFSTYGQAWIASKMLDSAFEFAPGYKMLKFNEIGKYQEALDELDNCSDHPTAFGMHSNADITFRTKQCNELLNTVIDMQPKESAASAGGPTREEVVMQHATKFLQSMPPLFEPLKVRKALEKLSGTAAVQQPLTIHLKQEVDRMQKVLVLTQSTLQNLQLAIAGTVIMTPDLIDTLNCMFDARVPLKWLSNSWKSPTIGLWFENLLQRTTELTSWLYNGRPKAYWLSGYFNPQGFLTAVRQEVTRKHAGWSLDDVSLATEVKSYDRDDLEKKQDQKEEEGVHVWGLFLEGAAWDRKASKLVDAPPKKLHWQIPCMFITAKKSDRAEATTYRCPCYTIPARTGLNFVFTASVRSEEPEWYWVLRGVALLCSKD